MGGPHTSIQLDPAYVAAVRVAKANTFALGLNTFSLTDTNRIIIVEFSSSQLVNLPSDMQIAKYLLNYQKYCIVNIFVEFLECKCPAYDTALCQTALMSPKQGFQMANMYKDPGFLLKLINTEWPANCTKNIYFYY